MRVLLPLVYFLFGLVGCDILPNHSITTRSDSNGVTTLHSVTTRTTLGAEDFSCRVSASGQCHYLVFVERCPDKAKVDPSLTDVACRLETLQSFSVAAGQSRTMMLSETDFRQCVAQDKPPVAPACARP